jgi:hypothetical protein
VDRSGLLRIIDEIGEGNSGGNGDMKMKKLQRSHL